MKTILAPKLPTNWSEREALRRKGQFWTPDWVAEAMVAYTARSADLVFDPCIGKGVFYKALKNLSPDKAFLGMDNSYEIIREAMLEGSLGEDVNVEIGDFILNPPQRLFKAIVANPPYIRHHRLSLELKNHLKQISLRVVGEILDGRAGLHIYFLIQSLNMLDKDGRLAFIMPADTCEGVFLKKLWAWISRKFRIDGVITFAPEATPFPGVDTNALVFLISREAPEKKLKWVRCLVPHNNELIRLVKNDLKGSHYTNIEIHERDLSDAISIGFSRTPTLDCDTAFTLGDFARVMRGIATGANEFFFLTSARAEELRIPKEFFLPAVGRTRDVEGAYPVASRVNLLETGIR